MKPFLEYFLICCCISAITTFSTQKSDVVNDYEILLTENQHKPLLHPSIDDKKLEESDLNRNNNIRFVYLHDDHHHPTPQRVQVNEPHIDTWSIIWFLASLCGLIAFFLAVSCSEWCCRPPPTTTPPQPTVQTNPDTPPPSYDQFAPPSYDSVGEKNEFEVYIVPVHVVKTITQQDVPPAYSYLHQN